VLLLLLSFAWGAAGFALRLFSPSLRGLFAVFILPTAFGGAVYDLWQYRKKQVLSVPDLSGGYLLWITACPAIFTGSSKNRAAAPA